MQIHKSKKADYKQIAPLLLLAMEEIVYNFIGEKSSEKAIIFLEELIQKPKNQYSYENCWIMTNDNVVVAVACVYDGALLYELRTPIKDSILANFNRTFNPEDETQAGEYYIDCVGVNPNYQGKGIGTKILQFLIHEYVDKQQGKLGLLVDRDNPNAKNLYVRLGFQVVDERTLTGKPMEHLQYSLPK